MALIGVPTGMIRGIMVDGMIRGLTLGTMVTDGAGPTIGVIGDAAGLITEAIGVMPVAGAGPRTGEEAI